MVIDAIRVPAATVERMQQYFPSVHLLRSYAWEDLIALSSRLQADERRVALFIGVLGGAAALAASRLPNARSVILGDAPAFPGAAISVSGMTTGKFEAFAKCFGVGARVVSEHAGV